MSRISRRQRTRLGAKHATSPVSHVASDARETKAPQNAQREYVHCMISSAILTLAMELAYNRRAG